MMRRMAIVALVLGVILASSLLSAGSASSQTGGVTLTVAEAATGVGDVEADAGAEVTVRVAVSGTQTMQGLQFTLVFDASVAQFVSVARADLPGNLLYQANSQAPGEVSVIVVADGPIGISGFDIANVAFNLVGEPGDSTLLTFAGVAAGDASVPSKPLDVTLIGGSITILPLETPTVPSSPTATPAPTPTPTLAPAAGTPTQAGPPTLTPTPTSRQPTPTPTPSLTVTATVTAPEATKTPTPAPLTPEPSPEPLTPTATRTTLAAASTPAPSPSPETLDPTATPTQPIPSPTPTQPEPSPTPQATATAITSIAEAPLTAGAAQSPESPTTPSVARSQGVQTAPPAESAEPVTSEQQPESSGGMSCNSATLGAPLSASGLGDLMLLGLVVAALGGPLRLRRRRSGSNLKSGHPSQ